MIRRILIKAGLFFVIWVALSGKFNLMHITIGLCISLGIAWLNTGPVTGPEIPLSLRGGLAYFPWLFSRIFASSVHLARLILDPKLPIDPKLIRHDTTLRNHTSVVLLGNSITLTPGTITVEVSPRRLTVHTIDPHSSGDLLSGNLEAKVAMVFPQKTRIEA